MVKKILLTGGLGNLGSHLAPLLAEQGCDVYLLVRPSKKKHSVDRAEEVVPGSWAGVIEGDVTLPELGIQGKVPPMDALWHVAALVDLDDKHSSEIWEVNAGGTERVIEFCEANDIPHLVFMSTAYTHGRNAYEKSKADCELMLMGASRHGLKVTIFKPGVIIGTPDKPGPVQGVTLVAKAIMVLHRKMEWLRRGTQEALLLPPVEPVFRLKGDSDIHLNVIPADVVAEYAVKLGGQEGTFYLTNPNPPLMSQVTAEIGEALRVNFKVEPKFKASLVERLLQHEVKSISPYI